MEEMLIQKYSDTLNSYERIILNTKNEKLKNRAKESYIIFVKDAFDLDKENSKKYESMLEKVGIDKEIINNILYSDLNNENDNEVKPEEIEKDDKQVEVENLEESKKENVQKKELEEYVYNNVLTSNDEKLSKGLSNLILKLQDDLVNANELSIKTWIKNYISFVDNYQTVIDKEKMIDYMKLQFEEYDKDRKYVDKLDDLIKEAENNFNNKQEENKNEELKSDKEENKVNENNKEEETKPEEKITKSTEEPLKIVNIKKTNNSKSFNKVLGIAAIIGAGALTFPYSLPTIIVAFIIYTLRRKKGITNNRLKSFLKENNYSINEENELVDEKGNKITEDTIGKSKYDMLKQELIKVSTNAKEGLIKKEYKKNRLASILLNSKIVNKFKRKKEEVIENEEILENEEMMHKGMGKC